MYQIRILDQAKRELAELDKDVAQRVVDKIRWLAENFQGLKPEPYTGTLKGLFKLRVGNSPYAGIVILSRFCQESPPQRLRFFTPSRMTCVT